MKRVFFVLLCAITCMTLFTACNSSASNRNLDDEPTTEVQVPQPEIETPKGPEKEQTDILQGEFTPAEIQVTEPTEDFNYLCGEAEIPSHAYSVTIFFIDSLGNEYEVRILRVALNKHPENDEETRMRDEEEIKAAKAFFKTVTSSRPSDFRVEYDGARIWIYKNEKVTERKIGNATVRESEPKHLWDENYYREIHVNNPKAPFLRPSIIGGEGVTNASPSN